MKTGAGMFGILLAALLFSSVAGCSGYAGVHHDPMMDFGAIQTVIILPFENHSGDKAAGSRVRDVVCMSLMSTGAIYVVPPGEVSRALQRARIADPAHPSTEDIKKIVGITKADAVITGVIREYGEVKSGSSSANVISMSMQMLETQTGKMVWSASTTQGGLGLQERLFGGGGKPMNDVTVQAVNDLLGKLFF